MLRRYKHLIITFFLSQLITKPIEAQNQSNWQLMNGESSAICNVMQRPSTIFVGDIYGLIKKSNDKGFTWKLSARLGSKITNIRFINENVGFATNFSSDIIYQTVDGGDKWVEKRIIDPNDPTNTFRFGSFSKIKAINESTVILEIKDAKVKDVSFREVVISRDGGQTFNLEYLPRNFFHVSGDTLVAFGYTNDIFGSPKLRILKSNDAGRNWEKPIVPIGGNSSLDIYGVNYAYFFNSNKFYFTSANESDKNLYQTSNGGLNLSVNSQTPKFRVNWLHFKDEKNGLIHTNNATSPLYKSSDGGISWNEITTAKTFAPIIDLKNNELLSLDFNRTLYSNDYGLTWKNQSDNIYTAKPNVLPINSPYYSLLNAIDSKTYYCSTGGELVKSDDEGLTWKVVSSSSNQKYMGLSYHFTSADSMIQVISGNNLNYQANLSTDGGKTMKASNTTNMYFNGSLNAIPKFSYLKSNKKYIVSYATLGNPIFWHSKDGGANWAMTGAPEILNITVFNFQIADTDAWFFVGVYNGKAVVYKSEDQGKNWKNITGIINISKSGETAEALGLYFKNKSNGYVYGVGGEIYATTDGGTSWQSLKASLPNAHKVANFDLMAFRTDKEGYLFSNNNFALSSINNSPWVQNSLVPSPRAIEFNSEDNGAMLLQYGYFAKYFSNQILEKVEVLVNITSLEASKINKSSIRVFPNPFSDEIELLNHDSNQKYSLYNLLGNTVLENIEISNGRSISLKNLNEGTYILKNNLNQVAKIIKK
jgi:photosystem II stability/assembly factor-like uncharacterized protein